MKNAIYVTIRTASALLFVILTVSIQLFLFATLIEGNKLSLSNGSILISIAVIISIFLWEFLAVLNGSSIKECFIHSITILVFVLGITFALHINDFNRISVVKNCISIFCGTFLGIILGKRKHNKLRKKGKKSYLTTK